MFTEFRSISRDAIVTQMSVTISRLSDSLCCVIKNFVVRTNVNQTE